MRLKSPPTHVANQSPNGRHLRRKHRQGAILLVILSMLFMFTIMVLTFVMVTSRYRQASTMYVRAEQRDEEPKLFATRAVMQILRGPRDLNSPFLGHDLLGDVYSPPHEFAVLQAWIPAPSTVVDDIGNLGQLVVLRIRDLDTPNYFKNLAEADFGGRVITILSGPFSGMSSRIVHLRKRYQNGMAGNEAYMVIRMFDMPTTVNHEVVRNTLLQTAGQEIVGEGSETGPAVPGLLAGHDILMNGATFVGLGNPHAMEPHHAKNNLDHDQLTDRNEPWDVADNQNFVLAHSFGDGSDRTIPSMHRPALLNYEFNRIDRTDPSAIMEMIEKIAVRPIPMYYGNEYRNFGFTGSHPVMQAALEAATITNGVAAFNLEDEVQVENLMQFLVSGPWDVDNKGNGLPDSVWTDPQFPVMSTKDGRRYKILIAPLVEGMDGKANISAQGNLGQITNRYDTDLNSPQPNEYNTIVKLPNGVNATIGPNRLPQGRGYGPAEINLKAILAGDDFHKRRRLAELLLNRYGIDRMPGGRGSLSAANGADVRTDDTLIQYSHIGLPAIFGRPPNSGTQYYGVRSNPSAYGTPPDVFGRGFHAISHAGHPLYLTSGQADNLRDDFEEIFDNDELISLFGQWPLDIIIDERTENPYQVDLISQNSDDAPFSYLDLELMLRKADLDTSLQRGRLKNMGVNPAFDDWSLLPQSELVTTHSYEVPSVPRMRPTPMYPQGRTLAESMRQLVIDEIGQNSDQQTDEILRAIMPFELYRGNRLNINRLIGNGRDDQMFDDMGNLVRDRDGVVDNLDEIYDPSIPNSETVYRYFGADVKPFYAGVDIDPRMGRQLLARHIYCMLLAIFPDTAQLRPDRSSPTLGISHQQWLAQWAVNVVDYRDADATFTIFEYDTNPFDGWDVDGDMRTDEDANLAPNSNPTRGYVIGMERPDLMLTESVAFHDRRVKDTPWDQSLMKRDKGDANQGDRDLDQYRIPQGSWFFELFCARNRLTEDPVVPGDLYDLPSGALDLGRMAGRYFDRNGDAKVDPSADGTRRPVWRVVVADRTKSENLRGNGNMKTAHDPAWMTLNENEIRREVWFTTSDPLDSGMSAARASKVFYSTAVAGLLPGRYAVVGPRPITVLGSQVSTLAASPPSPPVYRPSPFGIDMTDGLAGVLTSRPANLGQTPPILSQGGGDILRDTLRSVPIIVAGNAPTNSNGWSGNERIGLNLTEPLPYPGFYYKKPTHRLAANFPLDSYYDAAAKQGMLDDVPYDQTSTPALPPGADLVAEDARPLADNRMLATRTYSSANYPNAAYLQRVADPTRPWDPLANPYVTVDTMDLDITVFNGEDNNHNQGWNTSGSFDQWVGGPTNSKQLSNFANYNEIASSNRVRFESRIKGGRGGGVSQNIWTATTQIPEAHSHRTSVAVEGALDYFGFAIHNSLGYLNDSGGSSTVEKGFGPRHHWDSNSAGYIDDLEPEYIGTPLNAPSPWVAWNDRPYNSSKELMTVPTSSPSRFLHEFKIDTGAVNDPYTQFIGRYSNLMNWYAGNSTHRFEDFLEFVEVPSPYVNTQELISPAAVQFSADQYDPMNDRFEFTFNDANAWLQPPFNTISRFRNPGKINLNMIPDKRVWDALVWSTYPNPNGGNAWSNWTRFQTVRRGYTPVVQSDFPTVDVLTGSDINFDDSFNLHPKYSSEFHGAFAPSTTSLRDSRLTNLQSPAQPRKAEEFGMLRPTVTDKKDPHFDVEASAAYRNVARNPHFAYEGIQKLQNLTTTQSNVYAIWLTVGYFEVTPRPADKNFPDGYQLGQEIGADDGSIERPRFFYLIDRSIPVGYEPGDDLNVEKVIRLQRRID